MATSSWSCHACTFINSNPIALACEVCQSQRTAFGGSFGGSFSIGVGGVGHSGGGGRRGASPAAHGSSDDTGGDMPDLVRVDGNSDS